MDGSQIPMFATGIGDGFYCDYWGLDADGEICELVMVFMNPALWMDDSCEDDVEAALPYFQAAFQAVEGDENPFVLYMLGKCYCELGNVNEAKKYFQLAYDYDDRKQIFECDGNKYLKLVEHR